MSSFRISVLLFWIASAMLMAAARPMFGVDLAQYYTKEQFACLNQHYGIEFAVVRAHHSWGGVDTNAPLVMHQARQGGIPIVDIYMFPCTSFNLTAAFQINSTVDYLASQGADFTRMWFDIEWNFTPGCEWLLHDYDYNCRFITELLEAGITRLGADRIGVYASASFWNTYMPNCSVAQWSAVPNWYANYDNATNYDDFKPCGGWTQPLVKQINDNVQGHCNMTGLIDLDWSESFPGAQ